MQLPELCRPREDCVAEEEGFEPPVPLQVRQFSRLEPSTTRPLFRTSMINHGPGAAADIPPPLPACNLCPGCLQPTEFRGKMTCLPDCPPIIVSLTEGRIHGHQHKPEEDGGDRPGLGAVCPAVRVHGDERLQQLPRSEER